MKVNIYSLPECKLDSNENIDRHAEITDSWKRLSITNEDIDALFQSPEWFDHLCRTRPDSAFSLGIFHYVSGEVAFITPLMISRYSLKFDIKARSLFKISFDTVVALGSYKELLDNTSLLKQLLYKIRENDPKLQSIYMDSIPSESILGRYLSDSDELRRHSIVYFPDGVRPRYFIDLPAEYGKYVSKFSAKRRYNFKRNIKKLKQHGNGFLDLIRLQTKEDVLIYLNDITYISKRSWQQEVLGDRIKNNETYRKRFIDLAEAGLLRSYLLKCNRQPCAFVIGYQYNDVFHYIEIAYDPIFTKYSPGTVLLCLLIDDLIKYRPAKRVSFGIGDHKYKAMFSTGKYYDVSVLIIKKTFKNKILILIHQIFLKSRHILRSTVHFMQKMLND